MNESRLMPSVEGGQTKDDLGAMQREARAMRDRSQKALEIINDIILNGGVPENEFMWACEAVEMHARNAQKMAQKYRP